MALVSAVSGTDGTPFRLLVPTERLVAVKTPGTITSTALKFQVSIDGGATFQPLYNNGTEYSVTVAANRYIALPTPEVFDGAVIIKPIPGSSEGASRELLFFTAER